MAKFKKNNPDYKCIYANINTNNEKKTLKGSIKKIIHNGVEIEIYIGYIFLTFILGDDTELIIQLINIHKIIIILIMLLLYILLIQQEQHFLFAYIENLNFL